MADTVQSGSLLDAATWGGTVPTSGTGNVLHACTGPTGTINCNVNIGTGGTLDITGAFKIDGDLTGNCTDSGPLVTVGSGDSLEVTGDVKAPDGTIDASAPTFISVIDGTLVVGGDVTAGIGMNGEVGANADINGAGAAGRNGGNGGIAIALAGAPTVTIAGHVNAGYGGSGGAGGAGYADAIPNIFAGGAGGAAGAGGVGIDLGTSTGTLGIGGSGRGGRCWSGGNGGNEAYYDQNSIGAGGAGGAGGNGGHGVTFSTSTCYPTVSGDATSGEGGTNGSAGSGGTGGGGGAAGTPGHGLNVKKATVEGDCGVGNNNDSSQAYGCVFTIDGGEVKGVLGGAYASGLKIICHGEVGGSLNTCIVQLPTAIASGEFLYFHPDNHLTLYATGIECQCSGRILVIKGVYDTISQDGSTALVMMSPAAHAICVGVTIPITAFDPDCPGENDVRDGVTYGGSLEGNIALPAAGDVRTGIAYGASGTEYTGTWEGAGGGFTSDDRTKLEGVWGKLPANHNLAGDNVTAALESILTEARGEKLDRLDADISSRAAAADWTPTRGAYLDNLNVGGLVASQAEVVAVQNNTRCVRVVPPQVGRPSQGSTAYRIELLLYDQTGGMEEPDAAPTIGVVNQQGQTRNTNLDSTTMTLVSTGRYRSTYTVASTHAAEELIVSFSVVEGGQTRVYANPALVVDSVAVDFTAGDRSQLAAIHQKLPGAAYLRGTAEADGGLSAGDLSDIGGAVTPPDNASIAAIKAKTDMLPAHPSAQGDAMTLTADERIAIADAVLSRDVSHVEAAAAEHSLCYTVLVMSESNTIAHAGKLTVYRTDGTTEFVQKTIATASGAAAVTGVS